MHRYGKVIFREGGEKGAKLQKTLIERLAAQRVIVVSKDTIEKWYLQDKMERVGSVHTYVLHDKDEVDIFRAIMESAEMQDESVKWKITRFEHDREFRKWVEKTEKEDWAEEECRKEQKSDG